MASKTKETRAGWGFPTDEKHAHFFIGGISLCGDLEQFRGPLDSKMHRTPDDCPRCRKTNDAIMKLAKSVNRERCERGAQSLTATH
jgi:hypothetical protein